MADIEKIQDVIYDIESLHDLFQKGLVTLEMYNIQMSAFTMELRTLTT